MKIFSPVVGLYTAMLLSASVVAGPLAAAEPGVESPHEDTAVVTPVDAATAADVADAAAEAADAVGKAASNVTELKNVEELKKASGLSGTVKTKDHEKAGDGGGMEFAVEASKPEGVLGNIAVPLADGKWAVPQGLPTGPTVPVDRAAADDAIARAETFVAAGRDLKWNDKAPTPLHTSEIVHDKQSKPYPIYCSALMGMVLKGWDYDHTTYAADKNTPVGAAVDFGDADDYIKAGEDLWQSNKLARWFYANGDLWLNDGTQNYEPGDLLFLSEQKPEGKDSNTGSYFGNIYHVAMYIGDNKVIHSYSKDTDGGVVEQDINDYLREGTSFIARPDWNKSGAAGTRKPSDPARTDDAANKDQGAGKDQGDAGGEAVHPIGPERPGSPEHQGQLSY